MSLMTVLLLSVALVGFSVAKQSAQGWGSRRLPDFIAQYSVDSTANYNGRNGEQCQRHYEKSEKKRYHLKNNGNRPANMNGGVKGKTDFLFDVNLDRTDTDLDDVISADAANDSGDVTDIDSQTGSVPEFLLNDLRSMNDKRGTRHNIGCDCKLKNGLIDLGYTHFPRYLINAVCQSDDDTKSLLPRKCYRGSECKPIEYKVRVLTFRTQSDTLEKDPMAPLLPDVLRPYWKFKTVTVAAGCFCSFPLKWDWNGRKCYNPKIRYSIVQYSHVVKYYYHTVPINDIDICFVKSTPPLVDSTDTVVTFTAPLVEYTDLSVEKTDELDKGMLHRMCE